VFFDCAGGELLRRYSETRRRHPLALDPPGAGRHRGRTRADEPLRRWSDHILDTTDTDSNALQHQIGSDSRPAGAAPPCTSCPSASPGGCRATADNVFDMRFLRNPHWVDELRPMTGLDQRVGDYVAGDPAYEQAVGRIEDLLLVLLPRYESEGEILRLDRLRLYRRATPLGPRRRARGGAVARGGFFAHG
jgi:UPF0042 nucleotide-binding protein